MRLESFKCFRLLQLFKKFLKDCAFHFNLAFHACARFSAILLGLQVAFENDIAVHINYGLKRKKKRRRAFITYNWGSSLSKGQGILSAESWGGDTGALTLLYALWHTFSALITPVYQIRELWSPWCLTNSDDNNLTIVNQNDACSKVNARFRCFVKFHRDTLISYTVSRYRSIIQSTTMKSIAKINLHRDAHTQVISAVI